MKIKSLPFVQTVEMKAEDSIKAEKLLHEAISQFDRRELSIAEFAQLLHFCISFA